MELIGEDESPFIKVPLNSDAYNKYNENITNEKIRQQIFQD
jgi:hypothetical protein